MKAVNLYYLTRIPVSSTISKLYHALSGAEEYKEISTHESASIRSLADLLAEYFAAYDDNKDDWTGYLDGFFFSFTIEHIGKEFDLLKISSDGEYIINIELKSEDIEKERIKKQLSQNRYYLSHTFHTIYSFTYVMSTGTLYTMNSRGYMRKCHVSYLIDALKREEFNEYVGSDIDRFFRSCDYLISPVGSPEKFLEGQYFLTNQQNDFKRKILECIKKQQHLVIGISGIAGTGKTLLVFDIALTISRKKRVIIIHAGMLRAGHFVIDERLKNTDIFSVEQNRAKHDGLIYVSALPLAVMLFFIYDILNYI